MGIFDLFKKVPGNSNKANPHNTRPERNSIVPVEQINAGNHGDHWAGLFGFDKFYGDTKIGFDMLALLNSKGEHHKLGQKYEELKLNLGLIELIALSKHGIILSSYPLIKSTNSISSASRIIKEWNHVGGVEAQIEAKCKDTFGIPYFAVDYLENRDIYINRFNVDIILTGIAYSVNQVDKSENLSDDFVGYMPSKEFGRYSVMDYIGKILELNEINIQTPSIEGYIAKLRLIQLEDDKDFFTIDVFINKASIQTKYFSVGERISGLIWIQGRIAP